MKSNFPFSTGTKNVFFTTVLLILSLGSFAQGSSDSTGVIIASEFHITRPLIEIFTENPVNEKKLLRQRKQEKNEESKDREHRIPQKFPLAKEGDPVFGNDPRDFQRNMGDVPGLPVKANWAGQTASSFRPYDPSGAIGPNHYIQMINSTTFKVYDKTAGTVLLTATLGNLWSPATPNNGDPIVMYDKPADRWFLAQFGSGSDKKIYIAVSQTNNPLGSWYTYTYVSPQFPDYLKFSVWTDGYYMTSNQGTQKVFAFNRSEILAGTPGARATFINYSPPNAGFFFCPLPGDAGDGVLPPTGTPCPILSYSDNGWGGSFSDAVNIYNMSVNWVPVTPVPTITLAANVATTSFDGSYDVNWDDVSQPGTTQKLDGIGGILMYRAQWKTWSGYNTIVLNWGVKINATQRSIKWCELRQNQGTGVWSMYQQGTYTPDANTRWMGSIAMNNDGSIGLSYLKSNSTSIFPGIFYTGRKSCDALGTMTVAETQVIAGTGSQTGSVNRVGDYSHQTVDPTDGVTFWSTSEYMGGSTGVSAARTRIFSYTIVPCSVALVASVSIAITSGSNPTCSGSSVTFTATPTNGGTTPVYQWKVNGVNAGTNSPTFTTTTLTTGQIVTVVMTSNLPGVTGNPATSNGNTMTINPLPTVGTTVTNATICAGTSTSITGTGANTYTCNPGGLSGTTVTVTPVSTTTYTVTGTTTTTGCTNTSTRTITANPLPSVGTTVTNATICAGTSTSITGTGANTYTWNPGGLSGTTVTVAPVATTTYTVTGTTTSTGCTKTATRIITVNNCGSTLNLKLYIEGFYTTGGLMTAALQNQGVAGTTSGMTDTITVQLRNTTVPFGVASTLKTVLNTNGTAICTFPISGSYYIAVSHRNGLQTWSATSVSLSAVPITYDFSNAANKAFGSNQVSVGAGLFAFYSGDLNSDENIDITDISLIEIDINQFASGYYRTDINGDGNVDILDIPVLETNVNNFIFSNHP